MTQPATWPALAEAVALVTARIHRVPSPGLSGDIPPGDVADALAALCAGLLRAHYPDGGAGFLREAGAGALNPETCEGDP